MSTPARPGPRPITRGDCIDGPRPCPWAGECRYGLAQAACSLDVADGPPASLEAVADALGLSRERVRQIQASALAKLRAGLEDQGLSLADLLPPDIEGRDVRATISRKGSGG